MESASLNQVTEQLESENSRDRLLGLAALRDVTADRAVPLILKVINDNNLQVRSMAVFTLGVKPTEACLPTLVNILETEEDYGIRADAAGALGYLGDIRAFEPLMRAFLESVEWLVRFSAAVSLGNLQDPRAYDALVGALDAPEIVLRQGIIAALGEIGDPRACEHILRFVQSEDWLIRQRIAEALGNLPCEKALSALKYLAKDPHHHVAQAASYALDRQQSAS
ncbi:PBS lyase HEAT domain protein repeat-containing protein [Thalassoporum mexicanum PCC 7367]|uniref:HEAT repeat domain-containing protein n=1 Tax=Thalassoporum mexicanum TaxID=3457544 RepID=UPI00029FDFFF|nr:HEAT repeat domain-containing protein [Pseudanabaena sp. PCC 7367]AFY71719.1 PBS lyase HEAT domain protein repeat-containing protein [Pseudanabaena sp. PCC 7367]